MSLFIEKDNIFESSIAHFVKNVVETQYSIPAFQREYIWRKKSIKIIDLLESINKEFNLGTIIFWDSNLEGISRQEDNLLPSINSEGMFTYIVDGQQRTLTLVSLFSSRNIVKLNLKKIFICLSKEKKQLYFSNKEPKYEISMRFDIFKNSILFEPPKTFQYQSHYQKISFEDSDHISLFEDKIEAFINTINSSKIIIGYKLRLSRDNLTTAVKQFEKINQSGIKLSQFDILDAVAFAHDKYKLSEQYSTFHIFEDMKKASSFSPNAQKIILNAYKLIKNYRRTNEVTQASLSANAISKFEGGDSSILKRILEILRNGIAELFKLNLKTLKDVPYINNITMYIFIKSEINLRNVKDYDFLYSLMFQTGILKSYDKLSSQKLIRHIKIIIEQLEINQPINLVNNFEIPDSKIFQTSYKSIQSFEKAILIYWLNKLKPQDYATKDLVQLTNIFKNAKEYDHIFPQSGYSAKEFYHSFANIALVNSNTKKNKGGMIPQLYFSDFKYDDASNMYLSQFITREAYNALIDNDWDTFRIKRAETMADQLHEHLKELVDYMPE